MRRRPSRNASTGTKPARMFQTVMRSQYLERHHPLTRRGLALLHRRGIPERQCERRLRQELEPEIGLTPDVRELAAQCGVADVREQSAREERHAHPTRVERERAGAAEAQR